MTTTYPPTETPSNGTDASLELAMEQAARAGSAAVRPRSLGELAPLSSPVGSPKATASPPSTGRKLSASDKERLTLTLARVCALQGQYGKTASELETLVEGFCWVLGHHPIDRIIDGIGAFLRTHRDIPKPSDIEKIMNPPPPKIDWPLYIELKKRLREGNVYVDRDEKQFIRNCENLAVLRQRGELQSYQEAQKQIESHGRTLLSHDGY